MSHGLTKVYEKGIFVSKYFKVVFWNRKFIMMNQTNLMIDTVKNVTQTLLPKTRYSGKDTQYGRKFICKRGIPYCIAKYPHEN